VERSECSRWSGDRTGSQPSLSSFGHCVRDQLSYICSNFRGRIAPGQMLAPSLPVMTSGTAADRCRKELMPLQISEILQSHCAPRPNGNNEAYHTSTPEIVTNTFDSHDSKTIFIFIFINGLFTANGRPSNYIQNN